MKKQSIGFIILLLVFIFPFRWVYLEYPDPILSNNTLIDGGRIQYVFYFLLCVFGFLAFLFTSTADDHSEKSNH